MGIHVCFLNEVEKQGKTWYDKHQKATTLFLYYRGEETIMNERTIDDFILKELSLDDQKIAFAFLEFLRKNDVQFIKGEGYWKDKIYYLIKLEDQFICFIAINDPDDKDNRWTIWSDDMNSISSEDFPIEKELKEIAWKHIDKCVNCGSCNGGTCKVIFGKKFDKICGCTFRIDNPNVEDLEFMKKLVEIRVKEILNRRNEQITT